MAAVNAALTWNPREATGAATRGTRSALATLAGVLIAVFGVVIGLHGRTAPAIYSPEDPIYPSRPEAQPG